MTNIEELRRLEAAATPREWAVATDRQGDYLVAHHEVAVCDLLDSTLAARQDARLIAAARNALPALLRVAEAAREKMQADHEWYAARDAMSGDIDKLDWDAMHAAGQRSVKATADLRAALAALEAPHEQR